MADAVRELYKGIESVCAEMGCEVAGGDIIVADRLLLALTVTGKTRTPKFRSGARPGDHLYVTGHLGSAEAGRMILANDVRCQMIDVRCKKSGGVAEEVRSQKPKGKSQSGGEDPGEVRGQMLEARSQKSGSEGRWAKGDWRFPVVNRHLRPIPRLGAMRALKPRIHGLIDTSDGLATDARHLSEISGVRIVLEAEKLPVLPGVNRFCAEEHFDPLDFVLGAGEDYELLFTSPRQIPSTIKGVKVTGIGRIENGSGLWIERAGSVLPVTVTGYDHLRVDGG
jgi:thiamine-monophosphate kinase